MKIPSFISKSHGTDSNDIEAYYYEGNSNPIREIKLVRM